MRRRLFRYGLGSVAAAMTLGMVAVWTAPTAHADNCSGMRDCLPGISAFVCVAVALLIVIVLAIVFWPEALFGAELLEEGTFLEAMEVPEFSEGFGLGAEFPEAAGVEAGVDAAPEIAPEVVPEAMPEVPPEAPPEAPANTPPLGNLLQDLTDMLNAGDANGAEQAVRTLAQQPGGQALIDAGYQYVQNVLGSLGNLPGLPEASPAEIAELQNLLKLLRAFAL